MTGAEMDAGANGVGLNVVILSDGYRWFARGREIDYAAQASTLKEVKHVFENGLSTLVSWHLGAAGNVNGMLKPTPESMWSELWQAGKVFNVSSMEFTNRSLLKTLPFSGISYFEQKQWVATVVSIGQREKEIVRLKSPKRRAG